MTGYTSRRWDEPPRLPTTHFLDNRIYTDTSVFADEQTKIFAGGWKLVCHESELCVSGDYRVSRVAGMGIVTLRNKAGEIRSYLNVCPHRGSELIRTPRGNLARGFQCIYHHWMFDLDGRCTGMTRPVGYERCGLKEKDVGLRAVRTENFCGLVFVSLKDDVVSVRDYLGGISEYLTQHLAAAQFEVFHYHSMEINANWKLWNDNNSETYHEFLHVLNRRTGIAHPSYHNRKWHLFPNGHSTLDQGELNYRSAGLDTRAANTLPGMQANGLRPILLFPDILIIIRATVVRIDTVTPLSPDRTIVEWRGLGLKEDTPEVRAMRIRHHNQVWGPAGQNLPEDIAAVEGQWKNMASGAARYSIIAREEDLRPHDDANLREFYQEWGRRVGRWPHDLGAARDESAHPANHPRTAANG